MSQEEQGLEQVCGFSFRKSLQDPTEHEALKKKLKSFKEKKEPALLDSFGKALTGKGLAEARKEATNYFKSISARFVAAAKMNSKRKPDEELSLKKCWELALALQAHEPNSEKVRVYFKPKKSGGVRPICVFGPRHGTAQRLVREPLLLRYSPKVWQFTSKGPKAAIAAAKAMQMADTATVLTLDIKNFYGSFIDAGVLKLLDFIPSDVVANVVLANDMVLSDMSWFPLHGSNLSIARSGVPQGSAVSPLVGELAISYLDVKLPPGVWFANYADDFLVISPSEDLAEEAKFALIAAIAALPSGHFILEERERATIKTGVTFLGHDLFQDGGKIVAIPTEHSYQKFSNRLEELCFLAETAKKKYLEMGTSVNRLDLVKAIAEIYWMGLRWLEAFSECLETSVSQHSEEASYRIHKLRNGTGIRVHEFAGVKPKEELIYVYEF